jgi:hypothetical protein
LGSPCGEDELCNEAERRCEGAVCVGDADADGDGSDSLACGGDDCDDDDPGRYPGNPEVCDPEGVDEDCVGMTVGELDEDGDGFVSSSCCNGEQCGPDCDDSTRSVGPTVTERCNGIDDDCDSEVDEVVDPPLCPGGTCSDGRCRLESWDRTFGGVEGDVARDVALDAAGNLYVVGTFGSDVRFGTSTETASGSADVFVLALAGDGRYRWHRTFGGPARDFAYGIAAGDDGRLYVTALVSGVVDLGAGEVDAGLGAGIVLALDAVDGSHRWQRLYPSTLFLSIEAAAESVVAAGTFAESVNFGGGARSPEAARAGVLLRLSAGGEYEWDAVFDGAAAANVEARFSSADAERTIVVGDYTGGVLKVAGREEPYEAEREIFVASLLADGALEWLRSYAAPGDASVSGVARPEAGRVVMGGFYQGDFDLGPGRNQTTDSGRSESFLLGLEEEGGAYRWHRFFEGSATFAVAGVAATPSSEVVLLGFLENGLVDVGGGLREAAGFATLIARYDVDGRYLEDRAYGTGGSSVLLTGLAVGRGESTVVSGAFSGRVDLGSGDRVSAGSSDALVFRPAR